MIYKNIRPSSHISDKRRSGQSRRFFLKGACGGAGTLMALPVLETLFSSDQAFAQAAHNPRVWLTYQPNGYAREAFFPTDVSGPRNFTLAGCSLQPLSRHQENITIFKHLQNTSGQGSRGNDHLVSLACYLVGRTIPHDDGEGHAQSVDYFISSKFQEAAPSPQRLLNLCANDEVDAKSQAYNNRYKNVLSFDDEGRFVNNTNHLRNVFDSLFMGFDPGISETDVDRRAVMRTSVIDSVLQDAHRLESRLGVRDQRVMDQYFTSVREMERRLVASPVPGATCEISDNDFSAYPAGPQNRVDRVGEHWKETARLLALAFQCEATRVASYLLGGEAAGARYSDIGINKHVHNTLSHSGSGANREDYKKVDRYHAEVFADVLDLFESTPVGTGNLLDVTLLLWGTGLGDGNRHERNNLMAVLAGRAGGANHGKLMDVANNETTARLMNTIAVQVGAVAPGGFGNSSSEDDVFDLNS